MELFSFALVAFQFTHGVRTFLCVCVSYIQNWPGMQEMSIVDSFFPIGNLPMFKN